MAEKPPMDPYEFLSIRANSDGSLTRNLDFGPCPPTGYPEDAKQSQPVASIDVTINTTNKTYVRIFHPLNLTSTSKAPIIFYYHGGGFILYNASTAPFHDSCARMAFALSAVFISVDYRLAPESHLPAAYEDAIDALVWLKNEAKKGEHKFSSCVDFSKCFLMGASSGGNIVYQAGLRALNVDLEPVKIIGLIMNQPFFGGENRTESEKKHQNDKILPLPAGDLMWKLSLPEGADRNHEYCNPLNECAISGDIKKLPNCFINGYSGDPLIDRQKAFADMLASQGVNVTKHFLEDGYHAVELFEPEKAKLLVTNVKKFIESVCQQSA